MKLNFKTLQSFFPLHSFRLRLNNQEGERLRQDTVRLTLGSIAVFIFISFISALYFVGNMVQLTPNVDISVMRPWLVTVVVVFVVSSIVIYLIWKRMQASTYQHKHSHFSAIIFLNLVPFFLFSFLFYGALVTQSVHPFDISLLRNNWEKLLILVSVVCFVQSFRLGALAIVIITAITLLQPEPVSFYALMSTLLFVGISLFALAYVNAVIRQLLASKYDTESMGQKLVQVIDEKEHSEQVLMQAKTKLEQVVGQQTQSLSLQRDKLEYSEEKLRTALSASEISLWSWDVMTNQFTQSDFTKVTGHDINLFKGAKEMMRELVHPDDMAQFISSLTHYLKSNTDIYKIVYRMRYSDGSWHWIEDCGKSVTRKNNQVVRVIGTRRDVSNQVKDTHKIKLLGEAFKQAPDALFVLDDNFNYTDVNHYFEQETGFKADYILGKNFSQYSNSVVEAVYKPIIHKLQTDGEWEGETIGWDVNDNSYTQWLKITSVNKNGLNYYIGASRNISKLQEIQKQLDYLSRYDRLTGFANEEQFTNHVNLLLEESPKNLSLIVLTVDRYKRINDMVNSVTSEYLMKQVSERINAQSLNADLISRTAKSDISFIYLNRKLDVVTKEIDELINILRLPYFVNGKEYVSSVSAGVSEYPVSALNTEALIAQSKQAKKQAYKLGSNNCYTYHKDIYKTSLLNFEVESELRHSLEGDEMVVYYQPKLNLATKRIDSVEALVRWQHPEKGLLMPNYFIPMAEESGLVNKLGRVVLEKSCRQLRIWQTDFHFDISVAVNISAQQLYEDGFVDYIAELINSNNLSKHSLELEITESQLLSNLENARDILNKLREMGIKISLDDFGTGYSTFRYLRELPVDILKIDRSFIKNMHINDNDKNIAQTIIRMATDLDMQTVAEGVEKIEQIDLLRKMGCTHLQGYLIRPPVKAHNLTEILSSDNAELLCLHSKI